MSYSLLRVTITIYDVGMVISDDWRDEIESDLWLLPPECEHVGYCMVEGEEHKRTVYSEHEPPREEAYHDWRFDKWAIHFKFDGYGGQDFRGGWPGIETDLERESGEMGDDYLYKTCLPDLLLMADDLIDLAVEHQNRRRDSFKSPIYEVAFVTLWEHGWTQCGNYFDGYDWDFWWELVGRVDINKLAADMMGAGIEKVKAS